MEFQCIFYNPRSGQRVGDAASHVSKLLGVVSCVTPRCSAAITTSTHERIPSTYMHCSMYIVCMHIHICIYEDADRHMCIFTSPISKKNLETCIHTYIYRYTHNPRTYVQMCMCKKLHMYMYTYLQCVCICV